ncbi:MAG TPA: lasso peptide biosynthesis B2 protein [Sulfurovum sp.]|uniref:lasso peptide biosynthesis B2 protein n=1 Tax=Sulfurovum sp. TaxID=1969726 RepID=UPI002F9381D8
MLSKMKRFITLPSEEKKLFFEAYVMLGIMRAALLTVSFKRLTRSLEHSPKQEKITVLSKEENAKAIAVGQAITRAAAYTPWESACLAQSLTAQKMLQKRGIPGVFYLGAAKDEENKEKMKAHAWTQCGETILTGGKGHEAYTVLSVFGWEKA